MTPRLMRLLAPVVALTLALFLAAPAAAQGEGLEEANQLFKQGQLERALERVEAFLKGRPKDARARFLKGLILTEQNRPNEAIKVFTELTHDFPELPEPYNNLAVLYAAQGQYDKARAALEMAIRTHPSYTTAHENLGDIYAKMASQAYDRALQLDRGNVSARTKLNLIRELFSEGTRQPKPAAARPAESAANKVALAPPASKPAPQPSAAKAAPEPAEKPAAAPAKAPTAPSPAATARPSDEVLKAVSEWARAWSENDVAAYLAHYAADFQTPKGETRAQWEASRKARIAKPRRIQVTIESPKVVFDGGNRATVTFRQHYRSDTLKVSSTKTLVMVKSGEKWLIQQERVGS
jgi:tetratricopeptide (TPR) repeat protein